MDHYNQPQKRNAEFFKPPNSMKMKVGSGGLSEETLDRAQETLDSNVVDFVPLADNYLKHLLIGIETVKKSPPATGERNEELIGLMLYPAMQLKANGGMFRYPLVTAIAEQLIQFLEVIDMPDGEVIEIVTAFYTTIRAVILGRITGDGGSYGAELQSALRDACLRYFERKSQA